MISMRRAAAAGCALLVTTGPALAQSGGNGADRAAGPPTVTVSASAEVAVQPDQAVVRLGVTAQAADAAAAQDQVNGVMQRVLEAVKGRDVPDSAVRTEELSLSPVYSNPPRSPADSPQEPRVVGYRASNVVSVEVSELARIGEIVDAGIEAGANQLYGISFRVRNDAGARAEAMRLAVEEARIQADAVADAMGMRIAGVREVVAGGYDVRPPTPYFAERAVDIAATSVEPGRVQVTANVTVTYLLGEGSQ
ncbi:MAG TPA: SIMPL domain-containing protein [Gammaproteobacteria bacterium]